MAGAGRNKLPFGFHCYWRIIFTQQWNLHLLSSGDSQELEKVFIYEKGKVND